MLRRGALLLTLFCALSARAVEKAPPEDVAGARAHARRGLALYEAGSYAEALTELERAYEKKAAPGLLFNLAQCHRQLGHLDDAARLYRSFLRTDPPEALAKQTRELLAKVELLQKEAAPKIAPPLGPAPAAALPSPPPLEPPKPAAKVHREWPWMAAGGVAAVALAGGIYEALASRSATNQLAQLHRGALTVDPATDQSLRNDAAAKYSRSKALYIASAVAAAAGVGLYFAF